MAWPRAEMVTKERPTRAPAEAASVEVMALQLTGECHYVKESLHGRRTCLCRRSGCEQSR
jgi:hypothetical protein